MFQPLLALCILGVRPVNDSTFPLHDFYGFGDVSLHANCPADLPVDFEDPCYLPDSFLSDETILDVFHVLHQGPQLQLALRPELLHLLFQVIEESGDVRSGQEAGVDVIQGKLGCQKVQVVLHD